MTITRDIIKDLLTVYLAGEASPDTRALIEDRLRTDPELARLVEQARVSDLPVVPATPPSLEKRALDRTRRHLRRRSIVLGTAIYVSLLPLSVTFNSAGFHGLLIEDWPERLVVLAVAGLLWATYWRMSRRMRVPGL
jgi:anti-sigma factor RsiW